MLFLALCDTGAFEMADTVERSWVGWMVSPDG
jgi:hypothetical protein